MNIIEIAVMLTIAAFLILLARGMMLIGIGSDAEHTARLRTQKSDIANAGWLTLDMLRTSDNALLTRLDQLLGRDTTTTETIHIHNRCGSTDVVERGATYYCYKCDLRTEAVTTTEIQT